MLRSLTFRWFALVLLVGLSRLPALAQAPDPTAATTPKLAVPLELPADVLLYEIPSQQARPHALSNRRVTVVQESAQWLRVQPADEATKSYYVARGSLQIRPDETVAQFVARGGAALPSAAEAATSKLTSMRDAVTFACWPPGPEERLARTTTSARGIATCGVMRIGSSMPGTVGPGHARGEPG